MDELRDILLAMGFDGEELNRAHLQLFIAYEGCQFGILVYVPPFIDRPQLFIRVTENLDAPSLLEIYTDIEAIKKIAADGYLAFIGENNAWHYNDNAPHELKTPGNFALRLSCTRLLVQDFMADAKMNNIKTELIN